MTNHALRLVEMPRKGKTRTAGIIQFHLSPPGLSKFFEVEARAVTRDYKGVPVKYLCLDDLLNSKLAVARDKDADDILFLKIKKQNQAD